MDQKDQPVYPLLEALLRIKGLKLQATYSNRNVAVLFGVSIRAIQARIKNCNLIARDLPGRATFLPADLEEYLNNSRKLR